MQELLAGSDDMRDAVALTAVRWFHCYFAEMLPNDHLRIIGDDDDDDEDYDYYYDNGTTDGSAAAAAAPQQCSRDRDQIEKVRMSFYAELNHAIHLMFAEPRNPSRIRKLILESGPHRIGHELASLYEDGHKRALGRIAEIGWQETYWFEAGTMPDRAREMRNDSWLPVPKRINMIIGECGCALRAKLPNGKWSGIVLVNERAEIQWQPPK